MPATAYCSLSRSPPGPWPSHYSSVQCICYFCSSFTCILYYVYLMLLVIGPNKVVLIHDFPDSQKLRYTEPLISTLCLGYVGCRLEEKGLCRICQY